MECCLGVIGRHASVRRYSGGVEEGDLERILWAARRAPTAWNLMPVFVLVVRDPGVKARIAEAVGGQRHVAEAPVFLVFSLDWVKVLEASRRAGVEPAAPGLGHLVEGLVDAGIMAGWAALAAESLGYGVAFIALYGNPCGVAEAAGLPEGLVPVVGLAIGRPGEEPGVRPRQDPVGVYGERVPGAGERASAVLQLYGERAPRFFRAVVAGGGYVEKVGEAMRECLARAGYRV